MVYLFHRKQERKIRGMLVDYRKRAERRQDFYEKIVSELSVTNVKIHPKITFLRFVFPKKKKTICWFQFDFQKADPTQFMQIHGRRCKIHLDPAVAAAGDSPAIMQVILIFCSN